MQRTRIATILTILIATIAGAGKAQASYNVKSYGARGDGSDATTAIRNAIAAAAGGGGGEIMFPAGNYGVSGTIAITSAAITLIGEGPDASVITASATTGDVVSFGPSPGFTPCGGIRGLSIKSSVTRTAGAALTIDGCQDGEFQNFKLATRGGDGIHISPTGHLAAALHFSDFRIASTGAFNGILVQGPYSDRYFRSGWINGDGTAGSRGINIQNSNGDWYTDIETVGSEFGVLINPGPGQGVIWGHMMNVLADQNTSQGFRITSSGNGFIWGMTFTAPWASGNGNTSTNGRGFYIGSGAGLLIENPRVMNNGGHGIEIAGGTGVKILGGFISANSQQSGGSFDAINVNSGASSFQVIGATTGGIGTVPQRYGINIGAGSDNFLVQGDDFTGANTAVQVTPGASSTRRFLGNLPYNLALEKASSPP